MPEINDREGDVAKKMDYIMTHESSEVDRLNIQHAVLTSSMGALLFAPLISQPLV
jgi:hypothetical protein